MASSETSASTFFLEISSKVIRSADVMQASSDWPIMLSCKAGSDGLLDVSYFAAVSAFLNSVLLLYHT